MKTSATTSNTRLRPVKGRCQKEDEEDVTMHDEDENSVATTMGVRANVGGGPSRQRDFESTNGSVSGNSFVLPKPLDDSVDMKEDDDISTLTEYSMDEEDDNVSQTTTNTTWTVVTTGTDSTTVPTRNLLPGGALHRITKRSMIPDNAMMRDNSRFKRRRTS
jgi:hypothetical protein